VTLAALLGALLLLWLTFGAKALGDKRNWPSISVSLLGMLMLAEGQALIGVIAIAAGITWLRKPWRRRQPQVPLPRRETELAEARDLLGLSEHADRTEIVAAHRRLISRNHPDSGGTEALAARLNAARDLLLK
jgi:DnaJ family protein C protein 19